MEDDYRKLFEENTKQYLQQNYTPNKGVNEFPLLLLREAP